MKNESIENILSFTEDLKKLLDKYKIELITTTSGSYSGKIDLQDSNGTIYSLDTNNYVVSDTDDNELLPKYIKKLFDYDISKIYWSQKYIGVFTDNFEKAKQTIENLRNEKIEEVIKYEITPGRIILILNTGFEYIWINPKSVYRGLKFFGALIDKNISINYLKNIREMLKYTCNKDSILLI